MKRLLISMVFATALLGTAGACSSQSGGKEKSQIAQKNVVLDKEMIHLFEKGQIKGIPFQTGRG